MASEVGTAYLTIIPSARGFASRLQGELASEFRRALGVLPEEGDRAGTSFASRFRGAVSRGVKGLGGILTSGLAAGSLGLVAGLGALTAFGLKSAATLEQTRISFNSLAGSVEAGGKVFEGLQKFAAATPFEFTDLTQSAGRFLAFSDSVGIARDQLIPFLTTVGNVVSVTGGSAENLDSVSLALGQIASRGKVTLDNINQLSNALPGFSGVAALAAARGQTQAQVMDAISAGTINASDGIKQLLVGMQKFPGAAGAMEAQSHTLLGVFSTFKDTIGQALAGAFAPVIPAIKDSLTQVTPIIGAAIGQLAPALGQLVASVLPVLAQLISGITPILVPLISALGPALATIGATFGPLGGALAQVATALAPIVTLFAQLTASAVGALVPVIAALAPALTGLATGLSAILVPLGPILGQIGTTLGAVIAPISAALGQLFAALGPVIGQVLTALSTALAPLLAVLAPLIVQLLDALSPLFPVLITLAKPLADIILALTPLIELIAQLLVLAVSIAAPIIKLAAVLISLLVSKAVAPLIELIAKALAAVLSPLTSVAKWFQIAAEWINNIDWAKTGKAILHGLAVAAKAVGGFFADLGKKIGSAVAGAFDAAVSFFAALPGRLLAGLKALPGLLADLAKAALDRLLFAIGFAIGFLIRQIIEAPGRLLAVISALWTFISDQFKAGIDRSMAFLRAIPGFISDQFTQAKDRAIALVTGLFNGVVGFFSRLPGQIASFVSQMWADARARFSAGVDAVVGFVKSLPDRLKSAFVDVKNAVTSFGSDAIDAFKHIGGQIIDGLMDGINGAIGKAVDGAKHAVGKIIDGAKSALGISSPSKVFAALGDNTMASYTASVERGADDAQKAVMEALRPPTAAIAAWQSRNMAAAAASPRPGDTTNIYPQRVELTIEDLEAKDARRNALARGGRPD